MKKIIQRHYYVLFLLLPLKSFSQQIYIGQNANEVGTIISADLASTERAQGYNQVTTQYEPEYNNGILDDIIVCKQNVPSIDLDRAIDYCTHYIISHNRLSSVIEEYSNISLQELESVMDKSMIKVGNYWFKDHTPINYIKLYLSKTGEVIKEYRSSLYSPVPVSILKQLRITPTPNKDIVSNPYEKLNTGVRKYMRDVNAQMNLEEKKREKETASQAKIMYEDLMNSYTNLGMVVNSDKKDLSEILPYFETLKVDRYLKINNHIKVTYQKDSLLNFLPKYFHNEKIYFTVTKNGELLSISNKTDSLILTTDQYPLLKQWINITGKVALNYDGKDYPINYKYPALNIQNKNCPVTTKYCFLVEGKGVGFIKDTSLIKNTNEECPIFIKYTFNKKEVERLLYEYTNIKNIKELKRIKGNPIKPKVIVPIPIIAMIQTLPRNSNLFILNDIKNREVTSITDNLNPSVLKERHYKFLNDNYYLEIYDPENQKFISIN